MQKTFWSRARIVLLLVAATHATAAHAASVLGTAEITGGPNNIDLQFSDNSSPVSISEFTSVNGPGTSGTLLGQVNVNGTDDGVFSLSQFGQGTHVNESHFQFSEVITNGEATDQQFSMDFLINGGMLETKVFETVPQTGEFIEAGYEIAISFGGATLFDSNALLRQVGAGGFDTNASVTTGGTSLGGVLTNPQTGAPDTFLFSWSAFTGTLDLGVLAAGASAALQYDVRTFGNGVFSSCGSGCGSTRASIGDPFNPSSIGGPDTITSMSVTPPTGVPEPSTLGLLGAGLLSLGFRRKRA